MDPKATLDLIVQAIEDNDHAALHELVEALATWMYKGGFSVQIDPETLEFLLRTLCDHRLFSE